MFWIFNPGKRRQEQAKLEAADRVHASKAREMENMQRRLEEALADLTPEDRDSKNA